MAWPWEKKLFYAEAYDAVQPEHGDFDMDGLDDLGVDGVDPGDIPASLGSSTRRGVTSGVAKRDNVISTN